MYNTGLLLCCSLFYSISSSFHLAIHFMNYLSFFLLVKLYPGALIIHCTFYMNLDGKMSLSLKLTSLPQTKKLFLLLACYAFYYTYIH